MNAGASISLDEYLASSYDRDLEYVDVLEDRNSGEWLHSLIQSNIIYALRRKYPHLKVVPELRSNTSPTRYRLPDVSVLLASPSTKYLLDPAHIAIEIVSEDDRMTKVLEKLAEYEAKGVAHVWLVDPRLHLMSVYCSGDLNKVDAFRAGDIELLAAEIFAE